MHAFLGQRHRAGAAEALAGCAHDGAAAFDPKIHCFTPVISGDFLKSDAATVTNSSAMISHDVIASEAKQSSYGKIERKIASSLRSSQ